MAENTEVNVSKDVSPKQENAKQEQTVAQKNISSEFQGVFGNLKNLTLKLPKTVNREQKQEQEPQRELQPWERTAREAENTERFRDSVKKKRDQGIAGNGVSKLVPTAPKIKDQTLQIYENSEKALKLYKESLLQIADAKAKTGNEAQKAELTSQAAKVEQKMTRLLDKDIEFAKQSVMELEKYKVEFIPFNGSQTALAKLDNEINAAKKNVTAMERRKEEAISFAKDPVTVTQKQIEIKKQEEQKRIGNWHDIPEAVSAARGDFIKAQNDLKRILGEKSKIVYGDAVRKLREKFKETADTLIGTIEKEQQNIPQANVLISEVKQSLLQEAKDFQKTVAERFAEQEKTLNDREKVKFANLNRQVNNEIMDRSPKQQQKGQEQIKGKKLKPQTKVATKKRTLERGRGGMWP